LILLIGRRVILLSGKFYDQFGNAAQLIDELTPLARVKRVLQGGRRRMLIQPLGALDNSDHSPRQTGAR